MDDLEDTMPSANQPIVGHGAEDNAGVGSFDSPQTEPAGASFTDADVMPHEIGATTEVKVVYDSGRSHCRCCRVWDDEKPYDDGSADRAALAEKQRERFAIVRCLDRHGRGTWKTHLFIVNSNLLKDRFKTLFADYPSVDAHDAKPSFRSPFMPFIHRWDRLESMLKDEQDQDVREHLALLVEMLGPETEESFKALKHIEQTGFTTFNHLNLIFVEGEIILHNAGEIWSAGILRNVSQQLGLHSFTVDVVDWNGEVFGVRSEVWVLPAYKGSQPLQALDVVPLRLYPDRDRVKTELTSRGRTLETLCGRHLKSYTGNAMVEENPKDLYHSPAMGQAPLNERIIIDTASYHKLRGETIPQLRSLQELTLQPKPVKHTNHYEDCYDDYGNDYEEETENQQSAIQAYTLPDEVNETLTDEQCFLAVARTKGFAVHTKRWCKFHISQIREIEWNKTALENLVLGEGEKRLLTGIVSSQKDNNQIGFDDFIEGKGKGVIILLSGPPGVGKTLTAECMAESLQRPLYRLGAADLGSTVTTLETKLSEALARCAEWDAVLLIDEADVFLEARTIDSLQRNEMISIFLRLLEYYTGVLLLTTNRPDTIDPAFESRIDIALNYENLTADSRAKVLQRLLQTLPCDSVDVNQEEIAELMAKPLNGRQIKSAIKTARILAQSEGVKLSKVHLDIVLGLRAKAKESFDGIGV